MRRWLVTGVAVLILGSTGAPSWAGDWLDVQGDAGHSGYQPAPGIIGPSTAAVLRRIWTRHGQPSRSPVVVRGSLYYPELARQPARGVVMRRVSTGGEAQRFGTAAKADFWIGQPVSDGDSLYAVAFDTYGVGSLRAFTLDGAQRWRTDLPGTNTGDNTGVADGLVFATGGRDCRYSCAVSHIQAYHAGTGKLAWQRDIAGEAGYDRPSAAAGHVLWPTTTEGGGWRLTALDTATGAEAWHLTGPSALDGLAATDGVVYTVTDRLCAWSVATGAGRWCRADRDYGTVAAGPGTVYATGDGHLTAFAGADGEPRWETPIDDPVHPPVLGGGVVFTHHSSGGGTAVLALDAASGRILSDTPTGTGLPGRLAFAEGRLFATADYSATVALGPAVRR